jgi:hypothetical protein
MDRLEGAVEMPGEVAQQEGSGLPRAVGLEDKGRQFPTLAAQGLPQFLIAIASLRAEQGEGRLARSPVWCSARMVANRRGQLRTQLEDGAQVDGTGEEGDAGWW